MNKNPVKIAKLPFSRNNNSKVIAVMNHKGGCGKTTTAHEFGIYLVRSGFNVLFWDNDPQCNLTQALGVTNDDFKYLRVNALYSNIYNENYVEHIHNIPLTVKRNPNLSKLKDSPNSVGKIGLIGGSIFAEVSAKTADNQYNIAGSYDPGGIQKDIYEHINEAILFYRKYYDYIIIDTSPSQQESILCKIAIHAADEIITPIDGLEAAIGIRGLINFAQQETKTRVPKMRPNFLLAMVKYQKGKNSRSEHGILNPVHDVLKKALGDYVCDHGNRESQPKRNYNEGCGGPVSGNHELYDDILSKISTPRSNIFTHWNDEMATKLERDLEKIREITQKPYEHYSTIFEDM